MAASKKTQKTPSKAAPKPAAKRPRGRPAVSENGVLDKKLIVACAFELSKTVPLQELSIVKVARELGVTPALIHYYLAGRDALTSGVMNSFFRDLQRDWPEAKGNWRQDIEVLARHIYHRLVTYAGVAAYMVAHNRFRLVQIHTDGEADFGIVLFERFVGAVRAAGFDARRTGMVANVLMELIVSASYATVRHRWPGDHGSMLERAFASLDPKQFPNTYFVRKEFVHFSGEAAFAEAISLTLDGLDPERRNAGNNTKRAPRTLRA